MARVHHSHFRAFTLVELLVVIAIIGILVSLLLPAVQQAREAARRSSCQNNVKQLAIGLSLFEAAQGQLPPGGTNQLVAQGRSVYFQGGTQFSWIVLIAPYIEETAVADSINFDESLFEQNAILESQPTVLMCPSESPVGRFFEDASLTNGRRYAKGNYAAYVSPVHAELNPIFPGALVTAGQPLQRIVDGVSNTIAIAEIRTRDHPQDMRGAWMIGWAGSTQLAFDMHHCGQTQLSGTYYESYCGNEVSLGHTQLPNNERSISDVLQICPEFAQAQLEGMPCAAREDAGFWSAAPRSLHPGGVHVSRLDGSVDFLDNNINEFVMAYLVSVNDQQVITEP